MIFLSAHDLTLRQAKKSGNDEWLVEPYVPTEAFMATALYQAYYNKAHPPKSRIGEIVSLAGVPVEGWSPTGEGGVFFDYEEDIGMVAVEYKSNAGDDVMWKAAPAYPFVHQLVEQ